VRLVRARSLALATLSARAKAFRVADLEAPPSFDLTQEP
jgi:hypothetical protein